jgi:hypothetical protein
MPRAPVRFAAPATPVALVVALVLAVAGAAAAAAAPVDAAAVVDRALERLRCSEEAQDTTGWLELTLLAHKHDRHGEPRDGDWSVYELAPLAGVPFARLVERQGRPLDGDARAAEAKRERELRQRLARGEEARPDEDGERIELDRELLGRFELRLVGREEILGHDAWRIAFAPRPGRLPERRRADRALNRLAGRAWVDVSSDEMVAVEFELTERVRLWWGVLGSLGRMSGRWERGPGRDGLWLSRRFDLQLDGRILTRPLAQDLHLTWRELGGGDAGGAAAGVATAAARQP